MFGPRKLASALLLGLSGLLPAGACSAPSFEFEATNSDAGGEGCPAGDCLPCPAGFGDCDLDGANGCEIDVRSSSDHCGRCGASCLGRACSGGVCSDIECAEELADCDGDLLNGCETTLTDPENCGLCGKACSGENGTAACAGQICEIDCDDGFADCDGDAATGCEADVSSDVANCGRCAESCVNPNGTARCSAGTCNPICAIGFGDCDGNAANGCETDLRSSLTHCGGCGNECRLASASETCDSGVCEIVTCNSGFDDCNGDPADGCEADLSRPESCGRCDNSCNSNGGSAVCNAAGACDITCTPGQRDCINGVSDGCETNVNVSVLHCGDCGMSCSAGGGTPSCVEGQCGISDCTVPFADCNGDSATPGGNGCETNTNNDASHCGGCGIECYFPNAAGVCASGGCVLDQCSLGWANCTAEAGCETRLGTTSNCLFCGEVCSNANGSTACGAGGCEPKCAIGWGDCDGEPDNGCETPLDTLENCGGCGVSCAKFQATASCATGSCTIASCLSFYRNCNNEVVQNDGCETNTHTLADCGGCDVLCDLPHVGESCGAGSCVALGPCDPGWGDCTSESGCETQLGTLSNCLTCGNACSNSHGTTSCHAVNGCSPICDDGFKSCDGTLNNGCERQIWTTTDCAACDAPCGFPNATASCPSGICTMQACNSGFSDCTAAAGCETAATSCGSGGSTGSGGSGGGSSGSGGSGGSSGSCGLLAGAVVCDDFEDGNANGWTPNGGAWSVMSDGSLVYRGGAGSFYSTVGSSAWTDQTVQGRVRIVTLSSGNNNRAGLVARFSSGSNYYAFQIDGDGDLQLRKGTSTIGATGCADVDDSLSSGTFYTLRMKVSGGASQVRIQTFVNDVAKHDCMIPSGGLASGSAGVATSGTGANASFDDFAVSTP